MRFVGSYGSTHIFEIDAPLGLYAVRVINEEQGIDRVFKSRDYNIIQSKIDEILMRVSAKESSLRSKKEIINKKSEAERKAQEITVDAEAELDFLENLLQYGLNPSGKTVFQIIDTPYPSKEPNVSPKKEYPPKPNKNDPAFTPRFGLIGILTGKATEVYHECKSNYSLALKKWVDETRQIDEENKNIREWNEKVCRRYLIDKLVFLLDRQAHNAWVKDLLDRYHRGDIVAIEDFIRFVLKACEWPRCFPRSWDVVFNSQNKMVVISYQLPIPKDLPTLKEVLFQPATGKFNEIHISEKRLRELYDRVLYSLCLMVIHQVFYLDCWRKVEIIAFNGFVNYDDPGTGNPISPYLISLVVSREEFEKYNLERVDPKDCFKRLRGIGSSTLYGLTPVQPLVVFDKNDKRFIEASEVLRGIDGATNLATIDWQEFEHLIREVFELEFSQSGGEVKITRGSRDGGVDAVAFDPDPIRGGKIIIQAKRYNNTVGVSAVRDLYGTLINEGASRGILISTSDYGPDAYEFAKGKPLTLLNGSNLLFLLEKHGYQARIDLEEAKAFFQENNCQ
jgi:restriction system protein